jgi:hypothetical protein
MVLRMAQILQFPSGAVVDPRSGQGDQGFPAMVGHQLAVAGVDGIIDLSDYQFVTDDPAGRGADVYLLVRLR